MAKLVRFLFMILILSPIACARLQLPTALPDATRQVHPSPMIETVPPSEEAPNTESFPSEFSHASSNPPYETASTTNTKALGIFNYGDQVESTLNRYEAHQWQFDGASGDVITIGAYGNFDTVLELWLNDHQLDANDDNGQLDLSSRIRAYTIPESGTYTIVVRGFGSAFGKYHLQLLKEAFNEIYSRAVIQFGQVVKGFNTTEISIWSFEGTSGDWILIDATMYGSPTEYTLDDRIEVFTSKNELISPSFLWRHPFRLPTTDNYSVVVRHKGAYVFTLSKASDEGDLVVDSLIDATYSDSLRNWHFQAIAGETYYLVVVKDALKNHERHITELEVKIADSQGRLIETQEILWDSGPVGDQVISKFEIPRTDSYSVLLMEKVLYSISKEVDGVPNYLANIESDKLREIQLNPTQGYLTDQIELKWLQAAGEAGWKYPEDPFVIRGGGGYNVAGDFISGWYLYGFEPFETVRLLFITDEGFIEHPVSTAGDGSAAVFPLTPQSESSIAISELLVVNSQNHIIRFRYWVEPAEPCNDGRESWQNPFFATRMMKGYQGTLVKNVQIRYLWDMPLGNPIGMIRDGDTFDVTGDGICTMLYDQDGTIKEYFWWPVMVHRGNNIGWLIEGRNLGGGDEELHNNNGSLPWIRPLFLKNLTR